MLKIHATGVCAKTEKNTILWKQGQITCIPGCFTTLVGATLIFRQKNEIEFYAIDLEKRIGAINLDGKIRDIAYLSDSIVVLYADKIVQYGFDGGCIEVFPYSTSCDTISSLEKAFLLSEVWGEDGISIWTVGPIQKNQENLLQGHECPSPSVVIKEGDVFFIGGEFCVYSWSPKTNQIQLLTEDVLIVSNIVVYDQKLFVSSHMIGDYAPSPIVVYEIEKNKSYTIEESDDGVCALHQDTLFVWNERGYKNNEWTKGCDWVGVIEKKDGSVETIWKDPKGSKEILWKNMFCVGEQYYLLLGTSKQVVIIEKGCNKVVFESSLGHWSGLDATDQTFWIWNDTTIVSHTSDSLLLHFGFENKE